MAQSGAPLFLIDADTRVASIHLEFPEGETLDQEAILGQVGLTAPGPLAGVQSFFDFLPLVPRPAVHLFSPLELGRDAVRIERFYRDNGFLEAKAEYAVRLDAASNTVDVTFRIHEGRPLVLDTIVVGLDGGEASLDSGLVDDWQRFVGSLDREAGNRFTDGDRVRLRSKPLEWLRTHGYPFASVRDSVRLDSARAVADLELRAHAGPRARVDSVSITGARTLSDRTLRREIPIGRGDWYSSARVAEGERQVYRLGLVRLALLDAPQDQPHDSTVTLQLRVQEGRPHLISGELGYATGRGTIARGNWQDRDFLGGARTLTLSGVANTGLLAATNNVERRFGISPTLQQPYVFNHRLSGTVGPFAEYRDDIRDRSFSAGTSSSLLFERGAMRQLSATWTISTRRVIESPDLPVSPDRPDTLLLTALPVQIGWVSTNRLGLDLTWGEVDNALDPRRGYITRASVEAAGPRALSSVQYNRVEGSLRGFLPLGHRTGLAARLSAGRLFPYGESVPDSLGDVLAVLLRLRDAVFTAGGTGDVRGWGTGLLGPKVPDLQLISHGDTVTASASRYVVLAGLARFTGSLELRLPFPFLGPRNGTHVFLDAGRVWTPDPRFYDTTVPHDPLGQERLFFGTGAGVEFGSIVGPISIDLGYKLNPSPLDLRDPDAVAKALVAGRPVVTVPPNSLRRFHLHIAIGRVF